MDSPNIPNRSIRVIVSSLGSEELIDINEELKKHGVVAVTAVAMPDDGVVNRKAGLCGHPLLNIGATLQECKAPDICSDDNHSFRGGSRGKGGKIKYRRG